MHLPFTFHVWMRIRMIHAFHPIKESKMTRNRRALLSTSGQNLRFFLLLVGITLAASACGSDSTDTGSGGTNDSGLTAMTGSTETGGDSGGTTGNTQETGTSAQACNTANEDASPDNRNHAEEEKEEAMYPGANCLACHTPGGPGAEGDEGEEGEEEEDEGRIFTAAGTIFRDLQGSAPAAGVTIEITDADGNVIQLTSNAAGNFFTEEPITFPASVVARKGDQEMIMSIPVPQGGCNTCHACSGAAGGKMFMP
ncbi:MAG: hypothetical protein D6812_08750 [Deltaproteobacteria bacterium]|nr:MAG: hypothetical protein D6812_08750 [Deltaproteobacteria bacterium]